MTHIRPSARRHENSFLGTFAECLLRKLLLITALEGNLSFHKFLFLRGAEDFASETLLTNFFDLSNIRSNLGGRWKCLGPRDVFRTCLSNSMGTRRWEPIRPFRVITLFIEGSFRHVPRRACSCLHPRKVAKTEDAESIEDPGKTARERSRPIGEESGKLWTRLISGGNLVPQGKERRRKRLPRKNEQGFRALRVKEVLHGGPGIGNGQT